MSSKHLISIVVASLVVGGIAFYGGTIYAKGKSSSASAARGADFRNGGARQLIGGQAGARAGFGGGTAGEVVSKDANSLTLKLMDGGSKVIFLSASTTVSKMDKGSWDDLIAGTSVTVNGAANADGSVTASMVQIRPAFTGERQATSGTRSLMK